VSDEDPICECGHKGDEHKVLGCGKCFDCDRDFHSFDDDRVSILRSRLAAAEGALRDMGQFHPRALKLIQKRKNFIVISQDEPYYLACYAKIRDQEKNQGTWTEQDEVYFLEANGG
jgi:hypothetical protein